MCLTTVQPVTLKKDRYGTYTAYKVVEAVFKSHSKKLVYGYVRTADRRFPLFPRKWHKDKKDYPVRADSYIAATTYPTGFHAFLTREGAEHWSREYHVKTLVVKVRVRDVTATGIQQKFPAVVAREIYLPKRWRMQNVPN